MGELFPLLGGGGVLTAFAVVLVYLLSSNRADRRDAQDAIDRAEARADKAEARTEEIRKAYDEARAARDLAERELSRHRPGSGGVP
ncbi:hypothetical protein ABGB07_03935 [Micromonosporaceae bacterium B7E4]